MLRIDKNTVYPLSDQWFNLLKQCNKISFYDCGPEVDFGFIKKKKGNWVYSFKQGYYEKEVCIEADKFSWFHLYFIWNECADINKKIIEYKSIKRVEEINNGNFRGHFSLNMNNFDNLIYGKLVSDFIKVLPQSNVMLVFNENQLSWRNFKPDMIKTNEYGVGHIPYKISGIATSEIEHFFRFDSLINSCSTGCEYENKFFKENYFHKNNMFID